MRTLAEVLEEYMEELRRERCTCGAAQTGSRHHTKACAASPYRNGVAIPEEK